MKRWLVGREKVAVDIGSSFIKAAGVKKTGERSAVTFLYKKPTPGEVFNGGFNPGALAGVLQQLKVEQGWGKKHKIVSSLGGEHVITRHVKMPLMPARDLARAVRWEAEKFIPVSLENMVIDYACLEKDPREKQQHLLVCAAPAGLAYEYHGAFKEAGLKLRALDLPVLALWRVFRDNSCKDRTVWAVADIGSSAVHVAFINKGKLKYSRSFAATGGAEPAGRSMTARELRRSLDFFEAREGEAVQKLILTGGCSKSAGLVTFLSRELELPVEAGTIEQGAVEFAAAIGLAMREMVGNATD